MKRVLKLIAINIFVLILFLLLLNFGAIVIYQSYQVYMNSRNDTEVATLGDKRYGLPNYENIDWARKHFQEFGALPAEYRSYIGWRRLDYSGETININEDGIRYTPQITTDNCPLVVFLGGSTIWGTGSDDKNTIPALFSKVSQGKYRTLNYGESGYNAFQGYLFLKLKIIEGVNPNIVISYDGVNEHQSFRSELRPFSHSRERQIINRMKGADSFSHSVLTLRHFFLKPIVEFISLLKNRYNSLNISKKETRYDFSEERTEGVAIALLESWIATKNLAEKHGAKFIAVLQPNAGVGKPRVDHLKVSTSRDGHYDLDLERLEVFDHLYPMVLKLINTPRYAELKDSFIDLSNVFDSDELYYIDSYHVSPNGNKVVASYLFDYLNNNSLK